MSSFRKAPSSLGARATPMTAKFSGNKLGASKIVERGNQQALGEVSGGAEDDEHAGRRRRGLRGHLSAFGSTWPPNLLRIAESSLSEKFSFSRERKRA